MIPILATLTAVVDVTFDVLEAGSHAIDRYKALRAARAPAPVAGALSFRDVERQRAQAQAGASHGTVTGPALNSHPSPTPSDRAPERGAR